MPELVEVREGDILKLTWAVPEGLDFPMPVDVRVGERVVRVELRDGTGQVEVGDADYAVDPDRWLLRK